MTSDFLQAIKTMTKGKSDKLSANLYEWCKKHAWKTGRLPRIYLKNVDFELNKTLDTKSIIVSYAPTAITGSTMADIFKNGGKATICNYSADDTTDITSWFWPEYIAYGFCLFDREHKYDINEHRFHATNEGGRCCNWCDKVQVPTVVNGKKSWGSYFSYT